MFSRLTRPSPALVLAFVALFAAIVGGAYAAKKAAKNSVISKSIKTGAVKNSDIGTGAVNSLKVADESLTGADINETTVGGTGTLLTRSRTTDVDSPAGAGFFTILTLDNIPAGSYLLLGKLAVDNDDAAGQDVVQCRLAVNTDEDKTFEALEAGTATDDDTDNITLTLPVTLAAAGQAILQCDNPGANAGDTDGQFPRITAIPVGGLSVQP